MTGLEVRFEEEIASEQKGTWRSEVAGVMPGVDAELEPRDNAVVEEAMSLGQ
jgi:hypothetical protein